MVVENVFNLLYRRVFFGHLLWNIVHEALLAEYVFTEHKMAAGTLFNGEKFGRLYKQQLFYKNDLFNGHTVVLLIIVEVLPRLLA